MVDPVITRIWLHRLLFFAIGILIVFLYLVPLQTAPSIWASPDILMAMIFAWVLRRPDYVPALLVAAIILIADLFFLRAPGLMAGLVVIGCEFLRGRRQLNRELPFLVDWAMVSAVIATVMMVNRLVLIVVFVDPPDFKLTAIQVLTTILAYPLVVLVSVHVLGVRKIAPGAVDALGHRL